MQLGINCGAIRLATDYPVSGGGTPQPGDPLSLEINADGISVTVTFKDETDGGTYLMDAANATLQDASTAKLVIALVSLGYDGSGNATTTARTVYGTTPRRVPGTTDLDETPDGSDLAIVFALSEPVYAQDSSLTYTILANLYDDGSQATTAGTGSVTNNSTLNGSAYFTPRGQWDRTPDFQLVDADYTLRFDPQYLHGVSGIAAVRFTAVGQTSSHTQDLFGTRTTRQAAGSLLYTDSYSQVIPLSGFTQGETIKNRVRVYGAIGDLVFDSDARTTAGDYVMQQDSTLTFTCNKTGGLTVYGVVDTSGTVGVASTNLALARASPFPTLQAALIAGATLVYYKNQAHTFSTPASTPTALGYWRTVTPDPTDLGGSVTIDTGFVTFKVDIRFLGGTIKLAGNLSILTSTTKYLWFDGCAMDDNGQVLAANFVDDSLGAYFTDCTFTDVFAFKFQTAGGDIVRTSFNGCDFGTASASSAIQCTWHFVANKGSLVTFSVVWPSSSTANFRANVLVKNNELKSVENSVFADNIGNATSDYFWVGNLFEGIDGLTTNPLFMFAEGGSENNLNHAVVAHNDMLGQRNNYAYNDYGTAAIYRLGWAVVANCFGNQEIKSDLFGTPSANRVGNWFPYYGTLNSGNFARLSDFAPDYAGLSSAVSASDPLFVDDRSGSTSGASPYHYNANSGLGQGDYNIGGGSPMVNRVRVGARHSIVDLTGTTIPNDGTGASGAYQL